MTKISKKLIIVDGHALIHRSFHALPLTLSSPDGRPTNAVYGFSSFLLKALKDLKPDLAIVTFDAPGPTFRHQAYDQYKATRVKAPDELYQQIPLVKQVVKSLGLTVLQISGYEADDLIGTISAKAEEEKTWQTTIITGDLDALQLVSPKTEVYTMSRGLQDSLIYNQEKIKERYQLSPKQIIDFKALCGDPSDNIPGISGIGSKGATELLIKYQNLENIIRAAKNNDPNMKPRWIKLISEQEEQARLSYQLAKINRQVPGGNLDWDKAHFPNFDSQKVFKLFSELGFKSLLDKVRAINENQEIKINGQKKGERKKYLILENKNQLANFFKQIKNKKQIAISGQYDSQGNLSGMAFSWKKNQAYYWLLECSSKNGRLFPDQNWNKSITSENPQEINKLVSLLTDKKLKVIGHNLKTIIKALSKIKIKIKNLENDLMIAAYLLNPDQRQPDLSSLVFNELGAGWENERNKVDPSLDEAIGQTCLAADFIWQLSTKFKKQLSTKGLYNLFQKMEMPLIPVLADMENNGIKLDISLLNKASQKNQNNLKKLNKQIQELAGKNFNPNSPKQLREILFTDLEIPNAGIKKTKTGLSTAEEELNKIKDLHPIIPCLQEYRELFKLQTTYLETLPKLVSQTDGRIHTNFQQTVASTGRLSSSDPNLQNIPVRTEIGRQIRQAFIGEPGWKLASFDYSQIELRISAHLSNDQNMIKAFKNNEDIHLSTAAGIHNIPFNQVDSQKRQEAKATNFGIIYGQGPHGLSQTAGVPYWQAKNFIDRYFQIYPGIKKMADKSIQQAEKLGYVSTLFGRQRPLININSSMPILRKAAARMAINAPIQGTAADIIKLAMIKIYDLITNREKEIKLLLQIHDELIFEIKQDRISYYLPKIEKIMAGIIKLKVPIVIDSKVGDNWRELK